MKNRRVLLFLLFALLALLLLFNWGKITDWINDEPRELPTLIAMPTEAPTFIPTEVVTATLLPSPVNTPIMLSTEMCNAILDALIEDFDINSEDISISVIQTFTGTADCNWNLEAGNGNVIFDCRFSDDFHLPSLEQPDFGRFFFVTNGQAEPHLHVPVEGINYIGAGELAHGKSYWVCAPIEDWETELVTEQYGEFIQYSRTIPQVWVILAR